MQLLSFIPATHASLLTQSARQVIKGVLPGLLREQRPDLVLYNAGADVSCNDNLGKFKLTNTGILERDRFVMGACAAAGVPVAAAIGGGYSEDHAEIVERHVCLHRAAAEHYVQLAAAAEPRRRQWSQHQRQQREQRIVTA